MIVLGPLVLLLSIGHCISDEPQPILDYFDEEVKVVSIPTKIAIQACVTSHDDLLDKIDSSTRGCLGVDKNFDWEDFSKLNTGSDPEENGLTIKLENAEVCFYEKMGWVADGQVKKQEVIDDFSGLDSFLKTTFKTNIGECAAWGGNFGSDRRKREAVFYENIGGEEDVGEDTYPEVLPEEAEERGGLMSWIWDFAKSRSRRQIKKAPAKKAPAKKVAAKKSVAKKASKQTVNNRGGPVPKNQGKKGGPQKKMKKAAKKKGPPQNKMNPQAGGPQRDVSQAVYNKLWCFDLAIEQALQKCVMAKILDL